MSKVYITDYIENPRIERSILGNNLTADISAEVEYLLVWHQVIDKKFLDRFPNLKGIVRYGVGYDMIDLVNCERRNISVCNTPDYGTDEVSDTAIAMIMNIVRGIGHYNELSRGLTKTWQENTNRNLVRTDRMTLGVIGAGRIGSSVIIKANAMKMNTLFFDPYVDSGYEKVLRSKRVVELQDLLEKSDIVSIHCPLTSETSGLVDKKFIDSMKPGASLVNTARGKIIHDIDDFYTPLKENKLNSLAFDVLPYEPPGNSKLIKAWRSQESFLSGRLIINPHTAYYSRDSFEEMRRKAAENILRMLDGKKPFNAII